MRILLPTEVAECGLACFGMVASLFGLVTILDSLRYSFTIFFISSRGKNCPLVVAFLGSGNNSFGKIMPTINRILPFIFAFSVLPLQLHSEEPTDVFGAKHEEAFFSNSMNEVLLDWNENGLTELGVLQFLYLLESASNEEVSETMEQCFQSVYKEPCSALIESRHFLLKQPKFNHPVRVGGWYATANIPEPMYSDFTTYSAVLTLYGSEEHFRIDTGYQGGLAIAEDNKVIPLLRSSATFIGDLKAVYRFNRVDSVRWYVIDSIKTLYEENLGQSLIAVYPKLAPNMLGLHFLRKFDTVCLGIGEVVTFNCEVDQRLNSIPFYLEDGFIKVDAEINGFNKQCVVSTGSHYTSAPVDVFDEVSLVNRKFYNAPFESLERPLGEISVVVGQHEKLLPVLMDDTCTLSMDFFGPTSRFQIDFVNQVIYWSLHSENEITND